MNAVTDIIPLGAIPGLIWAYRFDADGTASRVPDEETLEAVPHHAGWLWVHLNLSDVRAQEWIRGSERLPKGARDLLLSQDNHLRLDLYGDTVAGVFADLRREFGRDSDDIAFLRFALSDQLVISTRRSALHSVDETRRAIDDGKRLESAVGLLEAIVERFADSAAQTAEKLADDVDLIEDRVVGDKIRDERKPLAAIRRTSVRLHRQLVGLHSVFARMERVYADKLPAALVETSHRLATRLDTLHHDLHAVQERARLLQEEVSDRMSEETNRLLYIISILTALFVPPTFVTGVFGMNTKGLIFTDNDNAFIYAMLMCLFSAAAVYGLVKWSGRRR